MDSVQTYYDWGSRAVRDPLCGHAPIACLAPQTGDMVYKSNRISSGPIREHALSSDLASPSTTQTGMSSPGILVGAVPLLSAWARPLPFPQRFPAKIERSLAPRPPAILANLPCYAIPWVALCRERAAQRPRQTIHHCRITKISAL
ncbi:hypothetical protein METHP14_920019 [Pseudomonas sp. P14-2025]